MSIISAKLVGLHGAATAAAPAGYRSHLVGGPGWARDCSQVVGYLAGQGTKAARQPSMCASAPFYTLAIGVAKDCYPMVSDRKKLPDPDVYDAWVAEWIDVVQAVTEALYLWVDTDAANNGYDCSAWTFLPLTPPDGPRGGVVSTTWSLQFLDDTAGITS